MSSEDENSNLSHLGDSSLLSSRGKTRRYFIPVDTFPGQSQPFTLPAGASSCSIEACPQYMHLVHPHWRLNEHMKVRHGWPRKITQPNTDRRLTNPRRLSDRPKPLLNLKFHSQSPAMPGRKRRRSSAIISSAQDSPVQSSPALDSPASQRPQRVRKPTAKTRSEQENIDPSESDEPKSPPRKRTKARAAPVSPSPSPSHEADDSPEPPRSEVEDNEPSLSVLSSEGQIDTILLDLIIEYVKELQSLSRNKSYSPDTIRQYKSMAETYQDMLDHNAIKVNCPLGLRETELLLTMYKRLAEREGARAQVHGLPTANAAPPTAAPVSPPAAVGKHPPAIPAPKPLGRYKKRGPYKKRQPKVVSKDSSPASPKSTKSLKPGRGRKASKPSTPASPSRTIILKLNSHPKSA